MTTVTINAQATGQRRQARRGRVANRALWVLQVLTSALFVFASVPKLTADPMAAAGFEMMGLGTGGMYIVGALELLGAVALLVPVLCGLAALAQVALMIGAVLLTLIFVGGGAMLAMPAGTLVVVSVIAWARRRRTVELVALVRRYVRR
jgi:hypothetical protein